MGRLTAAVVCGAMVLGANTASAQIRLSKDWTERAFVNINAAAQTGGQDIDNEFRFDLYGETAAVAASRRVNAGGLFDMMGGYHLRKNLGIGVSASRRSISGDIVYAASIPDPVFIKRFRAVTGTLVDMTFAETTVGALLMWRAGLHDNIDLTLFGGPAVRRASAKLVTSVSVLETSNNSAPQVILKQEDVTRSLMGIQAGVEGRYHLTKLLNLTGFLRYTSGSGNLSSTVKLGGVGLQVGAGAGVQF